MIAFLLAPSMLEQAGEEEEPEGEAVELEEEDKATEHGGDEADGFWIAAFLSTLQRFIRDCTGTSFRFDHPDDICQDTFDEIPGLCLRNKLTEFTNLYYREFANSRVVIYSEDAADEDVRESLCGGCEDGWRETFSEYEGPNPEDVDEDEDEDDAEDDETERDAIRNRNLHRQEQRDRYEQDREEFEPEVIDRDFVCDERCDSFYEHVSDSVQENSSADTLWLKAQLRSFVGIAASYSLWGENELQAMRTRLSDNDTGDLVLAQLERAFEAVGHPMPDTAQQVEAILAVDVPEEGGITITSTDPTMPVYLTATPATMTPTTDTTWQIV